MKRFILCLAMLLVPAMLFAAPSMRIVDDKDTSIESRRMKSVSVDGSTNGRTLVSVTTIVPNRTRILGFSIIGTGGLTAELYDDSSIGIGRNLLINESEVTTTDQRPIWFPTPIKVDYGLVVGTTGGDTDVIIYYLPD